MNLGYNFLSPIEQLRKIVEINIVISKVMTDGDLQWSTERFLQAIVLEMSFP